MPFVRRPTGYGVRECDLHDLTSIAREVLLACGMDPV